MLDKKATELLNAILNELDVPCTTTHFVNLHIVILKRLEDVYLEGRKDQINRVPFDQSKDGTLKFPGQKS